jgi:potassium-transporting ATPase KdpC subunit
VFGFDLAINFCKMKQHILPALRLTLMCIVIFCGAYTLLIWIFAQAIPSKGNGETISVNNKVIGYALEGQIFSQDKYFWGRPSAANYNAAAGSGSNKGPSNPDYLRSVQNNIDSFLLHNPSVKKEEIPSDMVTASGSGLDPHISPASALIQIKRVASARNISAEKIKQLVENNIQQPLFGLFGTSKVNVLKLNVALDKTQP